MKNKKLNSNEIDKIFIDVLKVKKKSLSKIDMFSCVNWDSLNHVKLINRIEKKFKIKISTNEYIKLNSYKSICSFLTKSLK
jgi:acyl carrier protein